MSQYTLAILLWIGSSAQAALPAHQSLSLSRKSDGLDGTLEVHGGGRLTPPESGVVQLKDRAGHVLQSLSLEKPHADLTTKDLHDGGKRLIFVTQDYSAGMGSYSGPITQLLEVSPTTMGWAKAKRLGSGEAVKISLMQSLKTGWGYGSGRVGKGNDILKVSCRPDDLPDGQIEFKTTYSRFHREKEGWILTEKVETGCWENEGLDSSELPSSKKFP